jgi:two-component system response regulator
MTHGGTILLVEDNPDEADLFLHAFRERDISHDVVVARDGAEAMDYVFATGSFARRKDRVLPALILLDLKLPRVGGLAVLKNLRTYLSLNKVPIVVLTSSTEESDRSEAELSGADLYLTKPVDFDKFIDMVRRVDRFLVSREPS